MRLGRRAGRLISAGINIAVAFPGILLALFFAVIFGVGATGAVFAIGLAGAPAFGRLTHTLVAGIESRDFISAARIAGVSRARILVRHVLPNIAEPLVVNATIGAGGALLSFAGLSFLGLGVQQPHYDWGRLLFDGISSIYVNPAAALAPGAAVLLAGLAFNLFGESVAKGLGVGVVGGIPALPPAPPPLATDEVSVAEAHHEDTDLVLDVRDTPTGPAPVPGSRHVPLSALADALGDLPLDRPVIACCLSGELSRRAVAILRGAGCERAMSLRGGLLAYHREAARRGDHL